MRYSVVLEHADGRETVLHDRLSDLVRAERTFRFERLKLKERLAKKKKKKRDEEGSSSKNKKPFEQLQLRLGPKTQLVWPGPAKPHQKSSSSDKVEGGGGDDDDNEEKKKMTGYRYFVSQKRAEVLLEVDGSLGTKEKNGACMQLLAQKWKVLSNAEKKEWRASAPYVAVKQKKKEKKVLSKIDETELELTLAVRALVRDESFWRVSPK